MSILLNWLLSALAIIVAAYILPGVRVENFLTALVLAVVLGVINAILKPILLFLTLPITISYAWPVWAGYQRTPRFVGGGNRSRISSGWILVGVNF